MLSKEAYASLLQSSEHFPELALIKECSYSDVIGLFQLFAPARLLGPIGTEPKLNVDLIIAVSRGDLVEQIEVLEQVLNSVERQSDKVSLAPVEEVVTFYLDTSPFTKWSPFGYRGGRPSLNLSAVCGEA